MSDINILNQMIRDTAKQIPIPDNYGKMKVTLTEPEQPNSSVTIRNLPGKAVIIKADAFESPDSIFHGSHGECKRADFVIVADTEDKKVIICIEMKARKDSNIEIIRQLAGARCFMAYCKEIGKAFWNRKNFLDGYAYRFVSIGHTSIPKRKTRIERPPGDHDCPEKMLKIDWPHYLQFVHLAGGK